MILAAGGEPTFRAFCVSSVWGHDQGLDFYPPPTSERCAAYATRCRQSESVAVFWAQGNMPHDRQPVLFLHLGPGTAATARERKRRGASVRSTGR